MSSTAMESTDKRKFDETTDDSQPGSVAKQRKVIGPSLPPPQEADAASETSRDDDDDDDDDFGPSLPPSGPVSSVRQESTAPDISKSAEKEKENQRDQWMLQPPSHSDWSSKVDPTQLRSRKFNTGKSATASKDLDSSWVETPEERMRRLQDAVMGVAASKKQPGDYKGPSNAKMMEDQIKKYKVIIGIYFPRKFHTLFSPRSSFCSNIRLVGDDREDHSPRNPSSGTGRRG